MNGKDQQEMFSRDKPFMRTYVPPSNVTNTRDYVRLEHFNTDGSTSTTMAELSVARTPHNRTIYVGQTKGNILGPQRLETVHHSNSPYTHV